MSPLVSPRLRALVALCLASVTPCVAALWVDEVFADGERHLQQPPASLSWFTSSSASLLAVADGALVQQGGGRFVLAHFATPEAPLYLAPGEVLVLKYEIELKDPADSAAGLRVGLFSGAASRVGHDGQQGAGVFTGYRGYISVCNPAPTKGLPLRLMRRVEGGAALLNDLTTYASIGNAAGIMQPMLGGVTYTGTFTITRSASGQTNQITHAFEGGSLVAHQAMTTDSDPLTVFDTLAFHSLSRATAGFSLRSVRLETKAAVESLN